MNEDGTDYELYKETKVQICIDIFTNNIRIFKNNKIYNTRQIEGHYQDPLKKEQKKIQAILGEQVQNIITPVLHWSQMPNTTVLITE